MNPWGQGANGNRYPPGTGGHPQGPYGQSAALQNNYYGQSAPQQRPQTATSHSQTSLFGGPQQFPRDYPPGPPPRFNSGPEYAQLASPTFSYERYNQLYPQTQYTPVRPYSPTRPQYSPTRPQCIPDRPFTRNGYGDSPSENRSWWNTLGYSPKAPPYSRSTLEQKRSDEQCRAEAERIEHMHSGWVNNNSPAWQPSDNKKDSKNSLYGNGFGRPH